MRQLPRCGKDWRSHLTGSEKDPDNRQIQRQMTLLGKASITTIHSFCLDVIRSNFQHIDIDPNFRIADETESTLMKLEALDEVFEEQYEKEDNKDFLELLESYGGNRDDQILMDMVFNLYGFIQSSPWPEARLNEMAQALSLEEGADFGHTSWGRILLDVARLEFLGLKEMAGKALALSREAGLDKYLTVLKNDYDQIDYVLQMIPDPADSEGAALSQGPIWDKVCRLIESINFDRMPTLGKDADKVSQEKVKKIRNQVKAGIRKLQERIFTAGSEEIIKDLNALYPKMSCLAGLASDLARKYNEKKARKSMVDFNDLSIYALSFYSKR